MHQVIHRLICFLSHLKFQNKFHQTKLHHLSQDTHIHISKQQQSSDWGADKLSDAQVSYAASDVLYLHRLRDVLNKRLEREERAEIAQACFDFLPQRALLDLKGWPDEDIFSH
ncbi:MAG: hypothetical protein EBW35_09370 [Rhodobacterales bacterium]|nr:hypothetical protein [Rhodobacterales bacterium]